MKEELDIVYTLFDDEPTQKKLLVLTKWEVMMDDERNPNPDFCDRIERLLRPGKSYRVRMIVEEV